MCGPKCTSALPDVCVVHVYSDNRAAPRDPHHPASSIASCVSVRTQDTGAYQSLTPFHHEMIARNGMLVPSAARHPTIRDGHPAVLSTIRGDHSFQALPPRFPRLWRGFAKCTAGLGTAQLPNQDSSEAAPPSRLVGSFPMHLRNPFAKMPSISHCTYHPGSGQLQTYPCFWVVPGCRACSCTKQLPLRVKGTSNDDPQGVSWSYYMNTSKYIEPSYS
jgi:hypothetical protein